ncbi:hypothetical protein ABBQ38_013578 [Trebouxia sp. C0009 RCD-2024]
MQCMTKSDRFQPHQHERLQKSASTLRHLTPRGITGRPGYRPRQIPPNQACRASNLPVTLPTAIEPLVSSKLLQGSVTLALLAGIDAAWSGDWSRIGVISKSTEQFLQSALTALGGWHLLMGMCAYIIASQNGRPELPATAKALAVGTLPVLELILEIQTEDLGQ